MATFSSRPGSRSWSAQDQSRGAVIAAQAKANPATRVAGCSGTVFFVLIVVVSTTPPDVSVMLKRQGSRSFDGIFRKSVRSRICSAGTRIEETLLLPS